MHKLRALIKQVNKTHKGLGGLIAVNLLAAKAKKAILNVSPAGCGKRLWRQNTQKGSDVAPKPFPPIESAATNTVKSMLKDRADKYTSLTLAGLKHVAVDITDSEKHLIIDDLGAEKSEWSRTSTVTVLASLVHTHYVLKITQGYKLEVTGFYGSAALNIQPVLLQSLIVGTDWIAVVRDKVMRYYHMIRPAKPRGYLPTPDLSWGIPLEEVKQPCSKGKLWYQLIAIGLTQWSYARCLEHIPKLLQGCAALDLRTEVNMSDYRLLSKLMRPMQLERYIVSSYGFESGRKFENNIYCLLVEIASHGQPTIETICEDYKVSPATVRSVVKDSPEWVWTKRNSATRIVPTEWCKNILRLAGVHQKW